MACILVTLTVLMLDLVIPLGVAMGVPYILVVLISLWSPGKRFTVTVAVICSILTISAFFYKPPVPEMWKAVFNRILALSAIWVTAILGLQRKTAEDKREEAIREREKALDDIKILNGLIPICSSCKKIRDDRGYWNQLEVYIKNHSEADFSHGICPECAKRLYPELYGKEKE